VVLVQQALRTGRLHDKIVESFELVEELSLKAINDSRRHLASNVAP
jgi:hypothetical protein